MTHLSVAIVGAGIGGLSTALALARQGHEITLIELYKKGAIEHMTFKTWSEFAQWLESLDENGIQISLKLPSLVYQAVKGQEPSMQNFIVEAIKKSLKER